jgi:hypothetical protein
VGLIGANGGLKVSPVHDHGPAPLTVSDTASVSTTTSDPNSGNNTASDDLSFAGLSADLSVTKSCKPESSKVPVGGTGTCFIEVHNTGPSAAAAVTLADHIFSNGLFTVQTVTPSQGTCLPAAPVGPTLDVTINCNLGVIAAGGVATVSVAVTAVAGTDVNDHATVASSTPDPDTGNNQADGTLSFAATSADVSVTKSCAPDPARSSSRPSGICGSWFTTRTQRGRRRAGRRQPVQQRAIQGHRDRADPDRLRDLRTGARPQRIDAEQHGDLQRRGFARRRIG